MYLYQPVKLITKDILDHRVNYESCLKYIKNNQNKKHEIYLKSHYVDHNQILDILINTKDEVRNDCYLRTLYKEDYEISGIRKVRYNKVSLNDWTFNITTELNYVMKSIAVRMKLANNLIIEFEFIIKNVETLDVNELYNKIKIGKLIPKSATYKLFCKDRNLTSWVEEHIIPKLKDYFNE